MAKNGDLDPEFEDLNHKQALAAIAVGTGSTIEKAAEAAGLSPRQLSRLRAEPAFMAAVDAVLRRTYTRAVSRLVAVMATATDTLESICTDPDSPATARVSAARAILDLGIKAYTTAELETRVQQLEDLLNGK